jgi:hypothetical protein
LEDIPGKKRRKAINYLRRAFDDYIMQDKNPWEQEDIKETLKLINAYEVVLHHGKPTGLDYRPWIEWKKEQKLKGDIIFLSPGAPNGSRNDNRA